MTEAVILDASLSSVPSTPSDQDRWPKSQPKWMIQCDFDGTISQVDVIDSLLERFGQAGWQELETAWENGEIGSRACMQGQVALLDMSQDELHAHLDQIAIDPDFPAFLEQAFALGLPVEVVSDGMDYAIHYILRRYQLDHLLSVAANTLIQTGARTWQLQSPHSSVHCVRESGTCKCEQLDRQHRQHRKVLFVGDGASDYCVSRRANFVLAKSRLIDHCRQQGYAFTPFSTFGDARLWLEAQAAHGYLHV